MKSRREGGGFAAPLPRLDVAIPARLYDGGGAVRPRCLYQGWGVISRKCAGSSVHNMGSAGIHSLALDEGDDQRSGESDLVMRWVGRRSDPRWAGGRVCYATEEMGFPPVPRQTSGSE